MKTSVICFLLLAGFAAQTSAITIGEAVDGVCPEAKARLEENTVLGLALTAAKDVEITLPAGKNVIVVAPSDDAFTGALAKLALTPEQILGNPDLLTSVLALHLAVAPDATSDVATAVAGSNLMFMENGEPVSLADLQNAPTDADLTVMEGANTAAVEDIVSCDAGATVLFVDTVLLPGAAPSPGAAPAPAPSALKPLTIGALVGSVCPGILDVLSGPNFSTLLGLLNDPVIAETEITLPKGDVVIAAPTNDALAMFIKAAGDAANNKTIVTKVLANHIATAPAASDPTAKALSGQTLSFWTKMGDAAPKPIGIAALAATNLDGVITDGGKEMPKVVGSVACAKEGQYAFAIDGVLVPESLTPPAPAPGAAPKPSPAPEPVPSAAGVASMGFAAVAVAAAMLI